MCGTFRKDPGLKFKDPNLKRAQPEGFGIWNPGLGSFIKAALLFC